MPSVDAVGRYFPLVVAFEAAQAPTDPHALARWARWYDGAAACALQTLRDRATLDGFESALAAAGTPSTTPPADAVPLLSSAGELRFHAAPGAWPEDAAAVVLHSLAARLQDHTVWWTRGDGTTPKPVTVLRGLPAPERFAALLQGAF